MTDLLTYLTTVEAAKRLRISKPTLRSYVRSGEISAIETPLGLLFHPLEIDRFRKARLKSA